ncbi:unnamed protein product [Mytilus coruscus]|uniref:B box-type domain-containing protein n=1 Tax=Mytilus coruscus TaxID=42192 RepID=A0A6J8BYS6_MYTCO|nr:unnamed protein product [Mytilus coruscus]
MELFENTKNFPKENVDYLKYRSLISRTPLKGPQGKLYKPTSVLSLPPQQENYITQSHFPVISQQINLTSGKQSHRETKSAPRNIENRVPDSTEAEPENEENQQMSHSANINHKGSRKLEVAAAPYRVNQTIMYRSPPPSRHHRNCVPKKREPKSARNEYGTDQHQTVGNKSIGFDFCQEGHAIFSMSTRRHFRSRDRLYCDFCESLESINWYCRNCNKSFCTMCKHTHEMSRGSFTSYRDLMDRVFYQKTTLRHLAWRINDIKYQYENDKKERMLPPPKKK